MNLDKWLLFISERSGPLGVKIFFVISGYIITKLLLDEEKENGFIKIKHFYFRRVFRILPPFIFYILGVTIFGVLGWIAFDNSQLFYATGFLCNTDIANCGWNLGHLWPLSIIEQFYLLWPVFFLVIGTKFRAKFLTFLLFLFIAFSSIGILSAHNGALDNALSFACIAIGALYASSQYFRRYMRKYGLIIIGAFITGLGFLYFMPYLLKYEFIHQFFRLVQPFIILAFIILTYELNWFIRSRVFLLVSKLGLISYSLYLWQEVFSAPPSNYLKNSFLELPFLMFFFALFSYFFIEKPLIKWARLKTKKEP